MDKQDKSKGVEIEAVKPRICEVLGVEDMALINRISRVSLSTKDVYTFRANLCDNEVDSDFERFTAQTLADLSVAFIGKIGVFGSAWSGNSACIYKTEMVVDSATKTKAGDAYCRLIGYAYLPLTKWNAEIIAAIEHHEKREISIGCTVRRFACSICGGETGKCGHARGKTYGDSVCFANLDGLTDVFEWSFVTPPARQPRFTEDEVATMRVLYAAGARYIAKDNETTQWITEKPEWNEHIGMHRVPCGISHRLGYLPDNMFPSILPGQSVTISDIIEEEPK